MLCLCPECQLQVSDKAISCPHCGYPLKPDRVRSAPRKRMRLPNGFGQITQIKTQKLRKPYRAMITVGKDDYGKPICKLLQPVAYFETYNEAYTALVEYHKNPYELDTGTTMQELYDRFSESYLKQGKSMKWLKASWNYCGAIKNMKVSDVRIRHLKTCIEEGRNKDGNLPTYNSKITMKSLFNLMFDYAQEYELCDKNYARLFKLDHEESDKEAGSHMDFTKEEMKAFWEHQDLPCIDMILVQCYSGWRPGELVDLKLENINLEEGFMTGGKKTASGRNRIVPIHSKIEPIIRSCYAKALQEGAEYLFYRYDNRVKAYLNGVNYVQYSAMFDNAMAKLNLSRDHRPHDCRVQFATMAKRAGMDEYALKRIMGHTIKDITESVYTKRDFSWLKNEIEKIKEDV